MTGHRIVSSEEWLEARKELLEKEKEFSRLRDEMGQQIRDLPWERVGKEYVFDGPDGKESLSDLFAGRSQLLVYHFMFGPDDSEGCPACSLVADHYEPTIIHLKQRDVTLVTVSRAPLDKLQAYRKRMGWSFKWVSSQDNDFNWDYHVSFKPQDVEKNNIYYNYSKGNAFQMSELQGLSVFFKDEDGAVFHTYSTYARGLDTFLGVYRFLDIVPKGRDEAELPFSMAWVRRHDGYED
jgi:predicted dithiol-disulfide oxidoreductase (DUF899 family)